MIILSYKRYLLRSLLAYMPKYVIIRIIHRRLKWEIFTPAGSQADAIYLERYPKRKIRDRCQICIRCADEVENTNQVQWGVQIFDDSRE